ncbi:hypothetical protein D3C81_2019440 [compost metagenome]
MDGFFLYSSKEVLAELMALFIRWITALFSSPPSWATVEDSWDQAVWAAVMDCIVEASGAAGVLPASRFNTVRRLTDSTSLSDCCR